MISRIWTDHSQNHQASDPCNWAPNGAPQPGDTLSMTQGVMDISGHDLAGDTLGVDTQGFSSGVELDTREAARLNLGLQFANVHSDIHGVVKLTADVRQSQLHTSGGTIRFIGTNTFVGADQLKFDSNLTGSATLDLFGGGGEGIAMEIDGRVGRGLTFDIHAAIPVVGLTIDQPHHFKGLIEAPSGVEYVAFMGLHATSANLRDDMLRMFDGHRLVDTVRINTGAAFTLEQNSAGVMLSQGSDVVQPGGPGTVIPVHTA